MTTFTTQDRQDAQRTPLTEEKLHSLWYDTKSIMGWYSFLECARAIERAHGIGQ